MNFGSRLEKARIILGLNKRSFAKALDIPESSIGRYEKGDVEPGLDFFVKIASNIPQVNLDWLLSGRGNVFLEDKENIVDNLIQSTKEAPCVIEIPKEAKGRSVHLEIFIPDAIKSAFNKGAQTIYIQYNYDMAHEHLERTEEIPQSFLSVDSNSSIPADALLDSSIRNSDD